MGIAAYQRGSSHIRRELDDAQRAVEFDIMDRLNALPKRAGVMTPFMPIHFVFDHHGWWAQCPRTEFGYCYSSLHDAVTHWHVVITAFDHGTWIGEPLRQETDA